MTRNNFPSYSVFISYSRKDEAIVAPLTNLMRLGGRQVFRDADSITPGKRWCLIISDSIRAANTFVVFWSTHASNSSAVKDEISLAISQAKDVVPVLLDDTLLNSELAPYQWLDFRPLIFSVANNLKREVNVIVRSGDPNLDLPPTRDTKVSPLAIGSLGIGSVAGTAASTAAGAAIGSIIPGVGTVLGGVIGGLWAVGTCSYMAPKIVRDLKKEIRRMTEDEKQEIANTVLDRIAH